MLSIFLNFSYIVKISSNFEIWEEDKEKKVKEREERFYSARVVKRSPRIT